MTPSAKTNEEPAAVAKDTYRWVVKVQRVDGLGRRPPYVREVLTDGPWPDKAIEKALERINGEDNDMWQADALEVTAERVR